MRVLGVDPGLTRCGVGVVENDDRKRPHLIEAGVIRTPSDMKHGFRLLKIEEGITQWVARFHPDAIAIEQPFANHNHSTIAGTTQAAGIAMVIAAKNAIPYSTHTPSEVKAAITSSGRADKKQIGVMVSYILKLDTPPTPADAADAVAIALCHLWRGQTMNRYAQALATHSARQR